MEAAAQLYLQQMQRDLEDRASSLRQEIKAHRERERAVFRLWVSASVLAVLLILGGAVLLTLRITTMGAISELVGLLAGTGTAPLRHLEKQIASQRQGLAQQEQEESRVRRIVGVASMISDPQQRSETIATLAATLTDSLRTRPAKPSQGRPRTTRSA